MVIFRENGYIVTDLLVSDHMLYDNNGRLVRDHYAVQFSTTLDKPKPPRKTVKYRKVRGIDIANFCSDIPPDLCQSPQATVDELVDEYNTTLLKLLNKHAPLLSREVTLRPHAPWYSEELREAKRKRRQYERKWKSTGLEVHRQIYREQCSTVGKLLVRTRQKFYQDKISECGRDSKAIYNVSNHLLCRTKSVVLPTHGSASDLAEDFNRHFTAKIVNIRRDLTKSNSNTGPLQQSATDHTSQSTDQQST